MRFHEFWTNKVRRREANVPCGDRRSESSGTPFSGICFLPRIIACLECSAVLISNSMRTCERPRGAIRNTCGILTMVLILAGNGARAWAQTADPDDCLSTERILRRYVDALGG